MASLMRSISPRNASRSGGFEQGAHPSLRQSPCNCSWMSRPRCICSAKNSRTGSEEIALASAAAAARSSTACSRDGSAIGAPDNHFAAAACGMSSSLPATRSKMFITAMSSSMSMGSARTGSGTNHAIRASVATTFCIATREPAAGVGRFYTDHAARHPWRRIKAESESPSAQRLGEATLAGHDDALEAQPGRQPFQLRAQRIGHGLRLGGRLAVRARPVEARRARDPP